MKLLADIIVSFAETSILYFLYSIFFKESKFAQKYILAAYILDGLFCLIYSTLAATPAKRLLCSFLYAMFPLLLYRGRVTFKAAVLIIYIATLGLSELVVKALMLGYHGNFQKLYNSYEHTYFWGVLFSKTLAFILIFYYTISSKIRVKHVPLYLLAILLSVPAFSIAVFYFLQNIVYTINEKDIYIAYFCITSILLFFNLMIFVLFSMAIDSIWLSAKLEYEKQKISEQQEYHKNLAAYHLRIRQLYHDIHNHLLLIYQALQKNDASAATVYIENQLHDLSNNKMIYTGYLVLDTILDYKKQLARQLNSKYTVYSELEPNLPLSEELLNDLAIALANCIDNSIEAVNNISVPEQRWIKIILKNDSVYLYFQIENNIEKNVIVNQSELPKSTKADTYLHGLGLSNVKQLSEKYDGQLILNCQNQIFSVAAMFKY